jgi:uncharacterized protein YecE (DUF72 family)
LRGWNIRGGEELAMQMSPKKSTVEAQTKANSWTRSATYVGAAGWSIPSRYKDDLPGAGSHLERYAQQLNAVEINSSFHRHHRAQTYARWAASVPVKFRFAVKTPRALTHEQGLVAEPEVLDRFVEEVSGLGLKLAVLLVQLPPRLEFDRQAAARFFRQIYKRIDIRIACEPRHPSWSSKQATSLFVDQAIARVAADPPLWPGANEPGGDTPWVYFRWHGQPRRYYSDYGKDCLATLQKQLTTARAKEAWAIFDNTAHGFALSNALAVADALKR